jgi:predicted amidohydrolase YtcJ
VTRRRPQDDGARDHEQRLNVEEALAGYAAGPAYAMSNERVSGTRRVGVGCDAIVVTRPPRCAGDELLAAGVRAMIIHGVVRYAEGWVS